MCPFDFGREPMESFDERIESRQVGSVEEMRKFGKDKFKNCLRIILADEMRKFGKDKFGKCLRIILVEKMRKFGKDNFRKCLRIILVEKIRKFGQDKLGIVLG